MKPALAVTLFLPSFDRHLLGNVLLILQNCENSLVQYHCVLTLFTLRAATHCSEAALDHSGLCKITQ